MARILLTLMFVLVAAHGNAAARFVEGTHYKTIPLPVEVENPAKVEVVEVFSYMCVHCYNFDPYVEAWAERLPEDVVFMRTPASFSPDWEIMAQAYYTAEALGVTDQVHSPIFVGLHARGVDLRRTEALASLFADEADVDEADFAAAHGSFSVKGNVQKSKARTRAYRVTGVPSMVVHGKYLVDGRMAGGNEEMLQVVDFLIEQERGALQKPAE